MKIYRDEIKGITSYTTYKTGELEECRLSDYNVIPTKYGKLVPQYENPGIRRKDGRAFALYRSGRLKSISLNQQTEFATPIGNFPAELVTFYEDGTIDSLFPLNGQIGFSWSEEEEGTLAQRYEFKFPFGSFSSKISGLRFYKKGSVRSVILWPHEIIEINSSVGRIPVRIGFKLFENGMIESLEPAIPFFITTQIGSIKAFDTSAIGIDADMNSLRFNEQGVLTSLVTAGDIEVVNKFTGAKKMIYARLRIGLMDDDYVKIPVKISFYNGIVSIDDGKERSEWEISEFLFQFIYETELGTNSASSLRLEEYLL